MHHGELPIWLWRSERWCAMLVSVKWTSASIKWKNLHRYVSCFNVLDIIIPNISQNLACASYKDGRNSNFNSRININPRVHIPSICQHTACSWLVRCRQHYVELHSIILDTDNVWGKTTVCFAWICGLLAKICKITVLPLLSAENALCDMSEVKAVTSLSY